MCEFSTSKSTRSSAALASASGSVKKTRGAKADGKKHKEPRVNVEQLHCGSLTEQDHDYWLLLLPAESQAVMDRSLVIHMYDPV